MAGFRLCLFSFAAGMGEGVLDGCGANAGGFAVGDWSGWALG
jgi:hypothetical protein